MGAQIYSAIAEAMSEIGAITKGKKNQQQGFMYRGVDDVMNALQPILVKHRIFILPEVLDQSREERTTKSGGSLTYTILKVRYTFFTDDGSSVSATIVGEGMDSADKSSNKALSVAFKYACFQVFCIPTEEMKDPDAETPEETLPKPLICKECGNEIKGIRKEGKEYLPVEVARRMDGMCYRCGANHGIRI